MRFWEIDPDIKKAQTVPAAFYQDQDWFDLSIDKVFNKNWHWLGEVAALFEKGNAHPFTLLPGVIDEPLLATKDRKENMHLLTNVCTHRGKIIVEKPGQQPLLRCGYHGRCFGLDGQFRSMPCFEKTENFPSEADHLKRLPHALQFQQLWGSLQPNVAFSEMIAPMLKRMDFLPLDQLSPQPIHTKDYYLDAHWALYVDNFLEGFHIPYVHPALNEALTMEEYAVELFPWMSLQLGVAKQGETTFSPPEGHVDHGQDVLAYYWWLFPNMMFNFYPWGLSLNVVEPLGKGKTRIRFRSYAFDAAWKDEAAYGLDQTEMEDEAVVLSVQRGLKSRFYDRGRYSPTMETGVHHFHRILTAALNGENLS